MLLVSRVPCGLIVRVDVDVCSLMVGRSLPRDYSEECRFLPLPSDGDARDCAERAFVELVLRQLVWCLMGSKATGLQEMLGDGTHTSEPLLPSRRRKSGRIRESGSRIVLRRAVWLARPYARKRKASHRCPWRAVPHIFCDGAPRGNTARSARHVLSHVLAAASLSLSSLEGLCLFLC